MATSGQPSTMMPCNIPSSRWQDHSTYNISHRLYISTIDSMAIMMTHHGRKENTEDSRNIKYLEETNISVLIICGHEDSRLYR